MADIYRRLGYCKKCNMPIHPVDEYYIDKIYICSKCSTPNTLYELEKQKVKD